MQSQVPTVKACKAANNYTIACLSRTSSNKSKFKKMQQMKPRTLKCPSGKPIRTSIVKVHTPPENELWEMNLYTLECQHIKAIELPSRYIQSNLAKYPNTAQKNCHPPSLHTGSNFWRHVGNMCRYVNPEQLRIWVACAHVTQKARK